jgi:hypothetical protein
MLVNEHIEPNDGKIERNWQKVLPGIDAHARRVRPSLVVREPVLAQRIFDPPEECVQLRRIGLRGNGAESAP